MGYPSTAPYLNWLTNMVLRIVAENSHETSLFAINLLDKCHHMLQDGPRATSGKWNHNPGHNDFHKLVTVVISQL